MPNRIPKPEMGVNLTTRNHHDLPGASSPGHPSGSSQRRENPPGSSGSPSSRLTPSRRGLIVITYKDRGQSAKMHKTVQIRSNSQPNLL